MPYQLTGRKTILDWLAREKNPSRRESFLADLQDVATSPLRGAWPVPTKHLVFVRALPRSRLVLTFLFADQFKAVNVISIDELGPGA